MAEVRRYFSSSMTRTKEKRKEGLGMAVCKILDASRGPGSISHSCSDVLLCDVVLDRL